MIRALWTAGTGMNVHQSNLDVISNNIANVNTNGYKKSRADFQDLMYQTLRLQGVTSESGKPNTGWYSDRAWSYVGFSPKGVSPG